MAAGTIAEAGTLNVGVVFLRNPDTGGESVVQRLSHGTMLSPQWFSSRWHQPIRSMQKRIANTASHPHHADQLGLENGEASDAKVIGVLFL